MDVRTLTSELAEEHEALDAVVADLSEDDWRRPTPSPRWTVADQIAHLSYFDRTATAAIVQPESFPALVEEILEAAVDGDEGVDRLTLGWARAIPAEQLLAEWRSLRGRLLDAAANLAGDARIPWYGPSMSAKSFLTARLMETWAHGQDVVDALGAHRPATDRLRHVARLGVLTRGWTYLNRGEEPPATTIRVELRAPGGELHRWGPDDAEETVEGPMEDFCLVVTQRRHLDDTALVASGAAGRDWLLKAQAFAGPPTDAPEPGSRGSDGAPAR